MWWRMRVPLNSGREVVAKLVVVGRSELAPEEGGHVLGLDHVHGVAHQALIDRRELALTMKDDVRGELDLHQTPMVAGAKLAHDGTELACPALEPAMKLLGLEAIGYLLRGDGVVDAEEGVVGHPVVDANTLELAFEPVVPIEVDLQTKRCPRGHAHVAQSELLVDEVEVKVQALALGRFEKGSMFALVMPGPEARTTLHRREDMHQPRMVATLGQNLLDACLLAKCIVAADELDFQPLLTSQALSIRAQFLAKWLGPERVVEQPDVAPAEMASQRLGMGNVGQSPGDDHSVEAGQRGGNLVLVAFDESVHGRRGYGRARAHHCSGPLGGVPVRPSGPLEGEHAGPGSSVHSDERLS